MPETMPETVSPDAARIALVEAHRATEEALRTLRQEVGRLQTTKDLVERDVSRLRGELDSLMRAVADTKTELETQQASVAEHRTQTETWTATQHAELERHAARLTEQEQAITAKQDVLAAQERRTHAAHNAYQELRGQVAEHVQRVNTALTEALQPLLAPCPPPSANS